MYAIDAEDFNEVLHSLQYVCGLAVPQSQDHGVNKEFEQITADGAAAEMAAGAKMNQRRAEDFLCCLCR